MLRQLILGVTNTVIVGLEVAEAMLNAEAEAETEEGLRYGMTDEEKIEYYLNRDKWVVFEEEINPYRYCYYDDEYLRIFKGAYDTREEARANCSPREEII